VGVVVGGEGKVVSAVVVGGGGGSGIEEVVRCCGVLRTRRQSLVEASLECVGCDCCSWGHEADPSLPLLFKG